MRKNTLFVLSVLIPLAFIAQDIKPVEAIIDQPKHEIGMNLFSLTNVYPGKCPHSNVTSSDPYYKTGYNIFPGVYYKYHSGKNVLRLSFDYTQKAYSDMESVKLDAYTSYDYSYAGIKTNHDLKIGYQRNFATKKVVPFIFSDLVVNYDKFTAVQNYYWYRFGFSFPSTSVSLPLYIEQYLFGVAPGGGLIIKLSKNIVLTYEFSAIFSYSRQHEILMRSKYWTSEFDWRFNPVKMLGFGIAF